MRRRDRSIAADGTALVQLFTKSLAPPSAAPASPILVSTHPAADLGPQPHLRGPGFFGIVLRPYASGVTAHAALAAAATLVSLAFALSTLARYLVRPSRHELAWTISLFMFAVASAALWVGSALGWEGWSFRLFYLFGAILNVPYLALGTVYLLADRRAADITAAVVSLLAAFATGLVVAAPFTAPLPEDGLPRGSEVFAAGPRIAAALFSGVSALVIFAGAVWSAYRFARRRGVKVEPGKLSPRRLAVANTLIALGTLVLSAGGVLNSVLDEMDAFAVSLVVGISIIFVGFLITSPSSPRREIPLWYPPPEVARRLAERPTKDLARQTLR
jgi:hypothetical protein